MRDHFDTHQLNDLWHKIEERDRLISIFQKMLSVEVTEINFWFFASNQMTVNHHKSFQSLGYFWYGKYDFRILWWEEAAIAVSNCLFILIYIYEWGISCRNLKNTKEKKFHWALALGFYLAISLCMLNWYHRFSQKLDPFDKEAKKTIQEQWINRRWKARRMSISQ